MVDLFNREALRAKNAELASAYSKVDELKAEVNALTAKLRGGRVCDGYCEICTHGIKKSQYHPVYGEIDSFSCALDCKCKDFEKKEC